MSTIKSTKEMVYDARSNKSAMIEIEVQGWNFQPTSKSYSVNVVDYALAIIQEPTYPDGMNSPVVMKDVITRRHIAQKSVSFSKAEIDILFSSLGDSIDITESFSDELDKIITQALLLVTQQDPIYRVAETGQVSVASDWEIK